MATSQKKDHWNSQAYNSAAGFVPKLTTTVVSYLDPQPTDRILDIGCGDGELTASIASKAGEVMGLDPSQSFITTARERYPHLTFVLHDGLELESCEEVKNGGWDKVFSNAAMHWILRTRECEEKRKGFFENIFGLLRPGGKFVFEMGGHGNVAEVQTACISALVHTRVPLQTAREASPWFFPSATWMQQMMESVGFEVEKVETEYRPSKVESGRMEGWVKLMCAEFLDVLGDDEGKKEAVVKEICQVIDQTVTRVEDGSKWLGYVRLRGVGKKK